VKKLIVFLFLFFFVLLFNIKAEGNAVLSVYNSETNAKVGDEVTMTIFVNTFEESINVVSTDILYDKSGLEIVDIDYSYSVLANMVEENTAIPGRIYMARYLPPGEGFSGLGEIARLKFKVLRQGDFDISFAPSAAIISTRATDILGAKNSATITTNNNPQQLQTDNIVIEAGDNIVQFGFIDSLSFKYYLAISLVIGGLITSLIAVYFIMRILYKRSHNNGLIPYKGAIGAFLFVSLALFISPVHAESGRLFFDPAAGQIKLDQQFSIKVMLDSGTDEINSAVVNITYPADKIQLLTINGTGSVLPEVLNEAGANGAITIERYISSSYTGTGLLTTLNFKAIQPGTVTLSFTGENSLPTGYDNPPDALSATYPANYEVYIEIPDTALVDDLKNNPALIGVAMFCSGVGLKIYLNKRIKTDYAY
jgi:hypothetical protein